MIDISTDRTDFRAWLESPDTENVFSIPFGLVFDKAIELTPTHVRNRLCKTMVLHHAADMQCLKRKRVDVVSVRQSERQFMQKVFTLVTDLFMLSGKTLSSLVSVLTALSFATNLLLQMFQFF